MPENDPRIEQLLKKLDELQRRQKDFNHEINAIRHEISQIQGQETQNKPEREEIPAEPPSEILTTGSLSSKLEAEEKQKTSRFSGFIKTDLEKFIGENLMNKIGILITIIGVAIGARYAIDKELISPFIRIMLGYGVGGGLLFFAVRLKDEIPNFSAVLFSGAMAVFYIITFAAFSFYGLMGGLPAFLIMVFITLVTVAGSLYYNREVVAHIGLVGAYAVPFLVGGDAPASTLFIYMAIINAGVLSVAIYKYWKLLTYSAFAFTWLIYGTWQQTDYAPADEFITALLFSLIFFIIFYLTALTYKLLREKAFMRVDVWLILANAFVFYGFGYTILIGHETGSSWLGAFTAGNAIIHFAAAVLVYRAGLSDKNLFYLVAGLAVTFFTIAIPVELDGNWITLLWTGEAAILFWIGRSQQIAFYEKMSHPILALAFISLLFDWNSAYPLFEMENLEAGFTALFNIYFFTSLFFISAISFISWKDYSLENLPSLYQNSANDRLIRQLIQLTLIITVYFAFRLEIQGWFNQLFIDSKMTAHTDEAAGNRDILRFSTLAVFNYTMFFISGLILASIQWLKQKDTGFILFVLVVVCTVLFFENGLSELGRLKESYLNPSEYEPYTAGVFHIGVRYISFLFLGFMLYATHRMAHQNYMEGNLKIAFDALLYVTILWILSNELILWTDLSTSTDPYKLGLTILWAVYALSIIALGIKTAKKHLRVGAIVLLGITLLKLFFYDIVHLDAVARTIVFVTVGILLLLASYLYNRFSKEMK
jgi:uncharacterized membrane protein